jgi:cellulose synthase/poly-beta-1,6-N-acetylglucosamine synthase-like glycosyltransferase
VTVRAELGAGQWPWAVTEVDLADGLPALPAVDGAGQPVGGAFVLVRVFTEPVAGLWVAIPDAGMSREELGRVADAQAGGELRLRLRSVGWHDDPAGLPLGGVVPQGRPAWLLARDAAEASSVNLTVALCTRDRPEEVQRCLASLQEQSYPRLSVMVVDNAPRDDRVRRLVDSGQFRMPVRYVAEPAPGLSHARNAAVDQCETELIAFLDDDEVACRYWASELVRGFLEDPAVDCVTGVIAPRELQTPAQQLFERFGGHSKGRGFRPVTFDGRRMGKTRSLFPLPPFGTGGNMAFRLAAIRELGGFDTALGGGTTTCGGEDTDIFCTVLLDGRRLAYRPSALVWHYHRRTQESLRRQMYGYGMGLTAFYAAVVSRHPLHVFRLLALAPRAIREVLGSSGVRAGGLGESFPADLLAANRRGLVRGPAAYWMTRRRQHRLRTPR